MTDDRYVCRDCRNHLNPDARVCPACGASIDAHRTWANRHKWLAFFAFLSVVGAPVGVLAWKKKRRHLQAARAGLAVPDA